MIERISKRGSSTVEAALVLPLLIFIIIAIISTSMRYEKDIENNSLLHLRNAQEINTNSLDNPEDVTRARWLLE